MPTTAGSKTFVFKWADVLNAKDAGVLQAHCVATEIDIPNTLQTLPGGRALTRDESTGELTSGQLIVHLLEDDPTGVPTWTNPTALTLDNRFSGATQLGPSDFFILRYEGGFLLVNAEALWGTEAVDSTSDVNAEPDAD